MDVWQTQQHYWLCNEVAQHTMWLVNCADTFRQCHHVAMQQVLLFLPAQPLRLEVTSSLCTTTMHAD
jgi:hypothetical protein